MDTKDILIANNYSNALINIAKEGKLSYEKIEADLGIIKKTLSQSKDLKQFMTNPRISQEDKKDILSQVFSNEIDPLVLNFLKILVDKNRFELVNEIVNSYKDELDTVQNISRVKVTSAVPLNPEEEQRLKEKLENKLSKSVVLEKTIDESIIAGLVIKISDNVIDMSLKHKLEDLSKNIVK